MKYVFLFRGGEPPPRDIQRITSHPGVSLVEHDVARLLLVEATETAVGALTSQLADSGWSVAPETVVAEPLDPRDGSMGRDD